MADQNNNLTVLIKKADGSFARIPISDFQKTEIDKKPEPEKQVAPVKTQVPVKPQPVSVPNQKLEPKLPVVQAAVPPKEEHKFGKPEPKKSPAPVNLPIQNEELPRSEKPTEIQPQEEKPKMENKLERPVTVRSEPPKVKTEPKVLPKVEPAKVEQPKVESPKIEPAKMQNKLEPRLPVPEVKIGKEDAASLLEEEKPKGKLPLLSNSREKQVLEIMKGLSFKIAPANSNRLRTIIQLYLKDVRSESETRETLGRKEMDGGMGFTAVQIDEVIKKCRQGNTPERSDEVPSLKSGLPMNKMENSRLEKEIPMVKKDAPFPAVAAPTNPFLRESKTTVNKPATQSSREILDKQTTLASLEKAPIFPIKTKDEPASAPLDFKLNKNDSRTVMQDIAPSHIEMGPVDEIKFVNLVDFRRLSSNPVDAAKRLRQKFVNLKEESILLYLEALGAWHVSPLYNDYIEVVSEALSKRLPITEVCRDAKRIQFAELNALLQMEKDLP